MPARNALAAAVALLAFTVTACAAASSGHGTIAGASVSSRAPAPDSAVPDSAAPDSAASVRPPVTPRPQPDACARNTAAQRVIVDISAQHAWLCAGAHTVYQTPVTTGAVALPYDDTPLGTFHVQGRNRDTALTLADGSVYRVRYWVPFDAPLYGFHDASWQTFPFGSPAYRTHGSHGCVHLPMAAMSFLYRWVSVGATVTIRA